MSYFATYDPTHCTSIFAVAVLAATLLAGTLAPAPAQAQMASATKGFTQHPTGFSQPDAAHLAAQPSAPGEAGYWKTGAAAQQAALLRSRNAAVRAQAMQNIIVLSIHRPGEIDLSATVPALLGIYADDPSEQHQIMAVSALRAVGDEDDLRALYALSQSPGRSGRAQLIAEYAVKHHQITTQAARAAERAARYAARGDAKRAALHSEKAAAYRGQLQR